MVKLSFYNNKKWLLCGVVILILITSLISLHYYLLPNRSEVMADLDVLGFTTSGQISIFPAAGRSFTIYENNFSVNIPCEDSIIQSLQVIQSRDHKSAATLDTIIFSGKGNVDIKANDISLMQYQLLTPETTAQLNFINANLTTMMIDLSYPKTQIQFINNQPDTDRITISTKENFVSIFLSFRSQKGSLSIIGDEHFSLPITGTYVGILVNVTTPMNRAYTAMIDGNVSNLSVDDLDMVKFIFPLNYENSNIAAVSPKGIMAYGNKELQALGNKDLCLTDFHGTVHLLPKSDYFISRLVINGDVSSVISTTESGWTNLTAKNIWEVITFPVYLLLIGFSVFLLISFSTKDFVYAIMPSVLLFFIGSIVWSIMTQQELWIQNFFSYGGLLITTITFLINHKTKQEKTK